MKITLIIIFQFSLFFSFGQCDPKIKAEIDSFVFITEMPYMDQDPGNHFWDVVNLGAIAIPCLLEVFLDTTDTGVNAMGMGKNYLYGDIAYSAMQYILDWKIPEVKILKKALKLKRKDLEGGSFDYWYQLADNVENREKFKKGLISWFSQHGFL